MALAATAVLVSALGSLFVLDVVWALVVRGAWRSNYWLDQAHISRQYSEADPELGFVRKPFVTWRGEWKPGAMAEYRTDRNGFRNPPSLHQAEVVFIGDSYTEAAQVPEDVTFAHRVAQSTGLRAANLGRGGYGPQQELIVLRRYGLAYRPQYVVWQVFPGNDLTDAYEFAQWKKSPASGISLVRRYINSSPVRDELMKFIHLAGSDVARAELAHADGTMRSVLVLYRPFRPRQVEFGLGELRRQLDEATRICRERGIRFGVTVVPTMMRALRPFLRVAGSDPAQEAYFLEEYVSGWCSEIGCEYIDVLGPMRAEAAKGNRELFILNDEHLDVAGHKIVADAVTGWIRGHLRPAEAHTTPPAE